MSHEETVNQNFEGYNVGQEVEARVIRVDRGERRIGLSIRAMDMNDVELKALEAEAAGETPEPISTSTAGSADFGGLSAAFDNAFANGEWTPGE